MPNSIELRQELRALKEEMTSLNAVAEKESEGRFNEDQIAKWDKMTTDAANLRQRIDRAELIERQNKIDMETREELKDVEDRNQHSLDKGDGPTYDATFYKYLRYGAGGLNKEERTVLKSRYVQTKGEARTNVVGTDSLGGYAVNDTFGNRMIEKMQAANGFMQAATVWRSATGATYTMPTVDETAKTGERLGENGAANKNNFALGTFSLSAHKYGSGIMELSEELVQDNSYNLEGKLSGWAAARIGRVTNSDMTIGHAGSTHIGASNAGLVQSVTASGTEIAISTFTYSKLVDLTKSVNRAYRDKSVAKFALSDTTEGLLMKMLDGNNNPIWVPSTREGVPDKILGFEYFINDYIPEADTNDNICMLFGDFSKYSIRIAKDITLKRSTEYAWERGTIAYYAIMRIDAALEDSNAIKSLAVVSA